MSHPIAPKKPTQECAVPDPDEPLRQCDIVFAEPAQPSRFAQIYLIATADCDLANEKHFGRLLVLPIIPLGDYFMRFRVSRLIDDLRHGTRGLADRCIQVLNDMLFLAHEQVPERQLALDWILRRPISAIVEDLETEVARSDVGTLHNAAAKLEALLSLLLSPIDMTNGQEVIDFIGKAKTALGEPLKKGPAAFLENELQAFAIKSTPRDVFVIADLPPLADPGYVVALRFPEQLTSDEIATRRVRSGGPARFVRHSRVVWPYSSALMSQFASLYTAVGLPDSQRSTLELTLDIIAHNWNQEV